MDVRPRIDTRELELNLNEDYSALHRQRKDLVLYETAPLAQDMEITGPMTATIWAATDATDTDWNVMILDVHPDGRALRIQDGVMRQRFARGFATETRLAPNEAHAINIDLWFTAIVIPKGHRIRVAVSSAAFPKYDRNLNTGGDNERDTSFVSARQSIFHDAQHASFVRLPVIPRVARELPE